MATAPGPAADAGTFALDGETTINRMGFGAMRLCGPKVIGEREDPDVARQVLRDAIGAGVDFIDTADAYGPGTSERIVGETIGDPEDVVVATKAGLLRDPDGDWVAHGDPQYVRNQALVCRDRLRTDTIDLFQFHRPDPDTPFEESVHAFAELKDEGLVEHVGLSNVSVEQLDRARDVVEIATVQNRYSVAHREEEPVLEACENYGVGFVPWYPLAAGEFGEKRAALESVAEAHGVTVHQVALAWLLERSPVVLPIPGTGDPDHLAENVAAAGIELSDEEMARLE